MKQTEGLFNELMYQSIPKLDNYLIEEVSPHKYYYEDSYGVAIEEFYRLAGFTSHEFGKLKTQFKGERMKICSVSSSSRLCFLKYGLEMAKKNRLNEEARLEKHLVNGTIKSDKEWEKENRNDAQLDAFDGETFYECKCQEIFEDKGPLSKSYARYMNKYFNTNLGESNFVKGKIHAKASEFGITFEEDKEYTKALFDIKQLVTHLCAIIKYNKNKNKQLTLKYVFFKPAKSLINNNGDVKAVYEELEKEIYAIQKSKLIEGAKKHGVSFAYEWVYVDSLEFGQDPKEMTKELQED